MPIRLIPGLVKKQLFNFNREMGIFQGMHPGSKGLGRIVCGYRAACLENDLAFVIFVVYQMDGYPRTLVTALDHSLVNT